jgi:hypothetical protein
MPAMSSKATHGPEPGAPALSVASLILIRTAVAPATRAELQRDLAALVAPHVSGTNFRRQAELAIGQHTAHHLMTESRGRLTITQAGIKLAHGVIAPQRVVSDDWQDIRNGALIAKSLGLASPPPGLAKALERPEGLGALILQQHFGISTARVLSPADLRAELAVIALEQAFGNKIQTGLRKGSGLPARTGRLLAGQLLRKPRDLTSDGKLVSQLAAEIAAATSDNLDSLRLAMLRRLTHPAQALSREEGRSGAEPAKARQPAPEPANDRAPMARTPAPVKAAPGMEEFISSVLDAARPVSEGWPGNRKAFISRVWQAIRNARPEWELSEIAFKSMLAEAHRSGQLVLAAADLKDKSSQREIEESRILYKNTVWHYVRVED